MLRFRFPSKNLVFSMAGLLVGMAGAMAEEMKDPEFTTQPQDAQAREGDKVMFWANVTAIPPATFQWRFNGQDVPGATQSYYDIWNVRTNQAGFYTLVASNSLGVAESDSALLTVTPAPIGPGEVDVESQLWGAQEVVAMAVDVNENILLASGQNTSRLERRLGHGEPDPSFASSIDFRGSVHVICPLPDGRILVGGEFTLVNAVPRVNLVRLLSDGSVDLKFDAGTNVTQVVRDIERLPADRYLLAVSVASGTVAPVAIQLDSDGTLVEDFVSPLYNGIPLGGALLGEEERIPSRAVLAQEDGSVLTMLTIIVQRWLANGAPDLTFHPPVIYGVGNGLLCMARQPDGRLLLGGEFQRSRPVSSLARHLPDGQWDEEYVPELAYYSGPGVVRAMVVQEDGNLLVAGDFTSVNGVPRRGLARLFPDGTLDPSLADNSDSYLGIEHLLLRRNGTILVAGSFQTMGGVSRNNVAQLQGDGPTPPEVITDPVSLTRVEEQHARFFIEAHAAPPASYRWRRNGVTLPEASGPTLWLRAVTTMDAGAYDVVVSNALGVVTSAPAMLEVLPKNDEIGTLLPESVTDVTWGPNQSVQALAAQPDGRLILAGSFTTVHGEPSRHLARIHPDGSLDASFQPPQIEGEPGTFVSIHTLAVEPGGAIWVGGRFARVNGLLRRNLVRLHADGLPDLSFAMGDGFDQDVRSLLLQPDGLIWVGGDFEWFNNVLAHYILRLHPNGTLASPELLWYSRVGPVRALAASPWGDVLMAGSDPADREERPALALYHETTPYDYATIATTDGPIHDVTVLKGGSMLVVGAFTMINGVPRHGAALLGRYGQMVDGAWETEFEPPDVRVVHESPCGTVLVGGAFKHVNGNPQPGLAAFHPDGTPDPAFAAAAGLKANGLVHALELQASGPLTVGGEFTEVQETPRRALARLSPGPVTSPTIVPPGSGLIIPGGTNLLLNLDTGCWPPTAFEVQWQLHGTNLPGATNASLLLTNYRLANVGEISALVHHTTGQLSTPPLDLAVDQPLAAGALDVDFYPPLASTNHVGPMALQADSRLLVTYLPLPDGDAPAESRVIRLEPDGSPDATFEPILLPGEAQSLIVAPNGDVLVGGSFVGGVWRRNAMGGGGEVPWEMPIPAPALPGAVHALVLDADGTLYAGGEFAFNVFIPQQRLARFSATGELDPNFAPIPNGTVHDLALLPDGCLLVAGDFTAISGVLIQKAARLFPDGEVDTSFEVPISPLTDEFVHLVAVQPDGGILLAGTFKHFNGFNGHLHHLVRYLPGGQFDMHFAPDLQAFTGITAVSPLADGKVLIAVTSGNLFGPFSRGLRLHSDGQFDTTFRPIPGPDGLVTQVIPQPDGRVLLGGGFEHVNNGTRHELARLLGDLKLFDARVQMGRFQASFATVQGRTYAVESADAASATNWTIQATMAGDGGVQFLEDNDADTPRFYRLRVD